MLNMLYKILKNYTKYFVQNIETLVFNDHVATNERTGIMLVTY